MAEASCKTYSDRPEETDGPAKQETAEVFLGWDEFSLCRSWSSRLRRVISSLPVIRFSTEQAPNKTLVGHSE